MTAIWTFGSGIPPFAYLVHWVLFRTCVFWAPALLLSKFEFCSVSAVVEEFWVFKLCKFIDGMVLFFSSSPWLLEFLLLLKGAWREGFRFLSPWCLRLSFCSVLGAETFVKDLNWRAWFLRLSKPLVPLRVLYVIFLKLVSSAFATLMLFFLRQVAFPLIPPAHPNNPNALRDWIYCVLISLTCELVFEFSVLIDSEPKHASLLTGWSPMTKLPCRLRTSTLVWVFSLSVMVSWWLSMLSNVVKVSRESSVILVSIFPIFLQLLLSLDMHLS